MTSRLSLDMTAELCSISSPSVAAKRAFNPAKAHTLKQKSALQKLETIRGAVIIAVPVCGRKSLLV
jgi:hypothetical protein